MTVDEPASGISAGAPGRLGIGVISAGKVGAVLGAALRDLGHAITGVHAVSDASRTRAESLLPEVPILDIPDILRRSEMVLLAVPDDVLGELVAGLVTAGHVQTGHLMVHTSGRHGLAVLEPIRSQGAIPMAIHPAMTFTGLSLDLARLHRTAFGITADPITLPIAQALVTELGGTPVVVPEQHRATYHAALSHASNHLVTLTAEAAQILESIGIEDTSAVLGQLMNATLDNALSSGDQALTGPVARGDVGTVADHVNALSAVAEAHPELAEVLTSYRSLSLATARRAHARGAISTETFTALQQILG
ncbi:MULTISPECIES: Rossmann-like and DUF2520 domain-containing protein [Auritidibacter]|uniref:Rossmann-like and DUF2520 domain-containing protein n=1 Tax=Auritidibacter TaxID=1160973 RepID=UPI000D7269DC|nr:MULTISPECIES: DUF2520 domain-containing protein [Auritidibacter]AXR74358.1 DUF2520 domain-containing protein [Auritidibacter sp. NML130574]NIH72584.1 putative short-subunit dehydrogenase-like oxidoreductase (DUF2520 family) [Auritidibacter ignavus]PXA79034.1 oxidoreductase [Auritidibacter sp. NML120636]RMX22610.1 DUF2520 domain-containing protein [Auritidibacter ignavus]WGH83460.1 DUF2520 domain-containing protein [Auritidibacter ignavus]